MLREEKIGRIGRKQKRKKTKTEEIERFFLLFSRPTIIILQLSIDVYYIPSEKKFANRISLNKTDYMRCPFSASFFSPQTKSSPVSNLRNARYKIAGASERARRNGLVNYFSGFVSDGFLLHFEINFWPPYYFSHVDLNVVGISGVHIHCILVGKKPIIYIYISVEARNSHGSSYKWPTRKAHG
mgnify:CR=1 FL=1